MERKRNILTVIVNELENNSSDSEGDEFDRKICDSSTDSGSDTDSSSEYYKPRRKLHRMQDYLSTIEDYDEDEFKQHFRMSSSTCNFIINKVKEDNVLPTHTFGIAKTSAEKAVYMTIWYLANLNTFREIADKFDVTRSTAHHIISTIVDYLVSKSPHYIYWPDEEDKKRIKSEFKKIKGIAGILGAVDGTHIKIKRPCAHPHMYCNRKGDFSILLQGVCDSRKRFLDIFCGEAGSIHDARLLKKSSLYDRGFNGLFGKDFLLGDSAYPCLDWLIPPFKDYGNLSANQRIFNYRHSSSRIVIENAFGLLKGRYRRLKMFENTNIMFIVKCCVTAAVLHNICIDHNDLVDWENEASDESDDEEYVRNVSGIQFRTSRREQIFQDMFTEE